MTAISQATTFYDAEEYHQNIAFKNSSRYNLYRLGCGRDKQLEQVWNTSLKP